MLAEMAAQERLEQMGAQRARLRRAEHAREVERQLQQKRMAEAAAQVSKLFVIGPDIVLESAQFHPAASVQRTIARHHP